MEAQGQPCDLGQSLAEAKTGPKGGAALLAVAPQGPRSPSTRKRQAGVQLEPCAVQAALSWLRRAAAAPDRSGAPRPETAAVLLRVGYALMEGWQAGPLILLLVRPLD